MTDTWWEVEPIYVNGRWCYRLVPRSEGTRPPNPVRFGWLGEGTWRTRARAQRVADKLNLSDQERDAERHRRRAEFK